MSGIVGLRATLFGVAFLLPWRIEMSNPFDRDKLNRIHQLMDELFAIQDANDGVGELPPAKQSEYETLCDEYHDHETRQWTNLTGMYNLCWMDSNW